MAAAPEDKTVVVSVRVGPYSKTTKQIDSEQYTTQVTTRKLINTNGNTEGIFPSVNFRGILPTDNSLGIYRGNYRGKKN